MGPLARQGDRHRPLALASTHSIAFEISQIEFAEHMIDMFEAEIDAWRRPGTYNGEVRRSEVDDWRKRVASFTELLTKQALECGDSTRSKYVEMLEKLQSLRSLLKYVV